jgi:hypothetical protein
MITRYAVLYVESETGKTAEFAEMDFTEAQAIGAANAIIDSIWVDSAWVEKRVYDFVSMQNIHVARKRV